MHADPVGWWVSLGRPLRHLSRLAACIVLAMVLAVTAWGSVAVEGFLTFQKERRAERNVGQADENFGDMDLYRAINSRVATGENYYAVAADEQRNHGYPTKPFVTVRTPVLAWSNALFGAQGLRIIAIAVLLGAAVALIAALGSGVTVMDRFAAALALLAGGAGIFYLQVHLSHDMLSGLFLSLAICLYRPSRWWPALLAAACGVALRELAAPFFVLWLAFAISQRRMKEAAAVALMGGLLAVGIWLHAMGVAAVRLPTDAASQGWSEMLGAAMVLASMTELTVLRMLPPGWAGVLALLPLLGWIGLGGRLGLFVVLWTIGMGAFIGMFSRADNFYWPLILMPLYLAGLGLLPRALVDLARAISRREGTASS